MKTTRRGFFGWAAGLLAAPVVAKQAHLLRLPIGKPQALFTGMAPVRRIGLIENQRVPKNAIYFINSEDFVKYAAYIDTLAFTDLAAVSNRAYAVDRG